jgi:hypothetical protein
MTLPSFTVESTVHRPSAVYRTGGPPASTPPSEATESTIVPAQRCPWPCYEANVACTGFLLWNTCWCPRGGRTCPEGGWWVGGVCFGYWNLGCI